MRGLKVLGRCFAGRVGAWLTWSGVPLLGFAAIALAACGAVREPAAPTPVRSAAVPWISTPGQPLQGPVSQSADPPCTPGSLTLSGGPPGLLNESLIEDLALTNVSKTGCALTGPPTVTWRLAAGATIETVGGAFASTTVNLTPSESAIFDVGPPNRCPSYNPAAEKLASPVDVTLPSGGILTVSGAAPLDLQCGRPAVVEFAGDSSPAPPTSGEGALQVTMTAAATMSAGGTYQYVVTLTNPTNATVSLVPCPSYTEGMTGSSGLLNSRTYVLNCGTVGQLGPGASARFAMQYAIPPTIPKGPIKVWWWLQVSGGQLGGRLVEVS